LGKKSKRQLPNAKQTGANREKLQAGKGDVFEIVHLKFVWRLGLWHLAFAG